MDSFVQSFLDASQAFIQGVADTFVELYTGIVSRYSTPFVLFIAVISICIVITCIAFVVARFRR